MYEQGDEVRTYDAPNDREMRRIWEQRHEAGTVPQVVRIWGDGKYTYRWVRSETVSEVWKTKVYDGVAFKIYS